MGVIIRLLDATGQEVQDSISGDYEDSFCLETFEDLCNSHFNAEPKNTKGFVIARIQTLDPKQPDKTFYSYYNAFHLNKTLFQTQIYLKKRYIHRLHVLNPLTNSDIIGNVNYYLVKPTVSPEAVMVEMEEVAAPPQEVAIEIEKSAEMAIDIEPPVSPTTRKVSLVYDQNTPLSPLNAVMPEPESIDLVVKTNAVMFEEASDQPVIPTGMGILKRTKTNKSSTVKRRKSLLEKPINDIAPKKGPKAVPKLTITTKLPTGVVSVNGPASAVIEPGTITRFTVPVPKEEMGSVIPKTQKGHRRTLSYRNAVSASGVPASFLEWARMIQEEGQDLKSAAVPTPDDPNETEDFDVVKPFARHSKISPPKTIVSPDGKGQLKPSKLAPISDDGEEKEEEPEVVEPVDSPKIVFWDAVYIANDNDFLETSKIRQLFRSNAINPEDAKLFEMKEFTGEERNDQEFEIAGDAFPCESCYPTEQELTNMSPIVRFLHIHKCILLASLISILVIVFILVMMFTNFSGVSTNRPPN